MPNEGLSIYFTITDKASPTLASIGDKTKALDKETQQLAQSYAALQKANEGLMKKQTELQKALKAAKEETKTAKKAFEELGDAASQDAYDKAKQHQEELRNQLSQTNKALRENESIYKQNMETIRKSTVGADGTSTGLISLAKGLAAGQLGQMVASSLGGFLSNGLSSAIGVPEASAISSTLSGAISGATAGAIAGIPGMVIGGLVGAGSGLLSGYTEIQGAKDDAFKEYYAGLYEEVNANTESMITGGSTIAGSREQIQKAFAKRFGGDEAADEYLGRVQAMAASTNYGFDEITGYSQQLLNTYSPDEVFSVLQTLSDATAGLNLSSSDVNVMISGLSRMRTTGKATMEYLNYFSERGVDVYTALSGALGVEKNQISDMVSKGNISGEFAAQAVLDYINQEYGGLSEDLMSTYDAMTANLEDIMATLEAAGGEGYNEMRKAGLEAEAEAYGGALGDALQEINRISGENQAYLENLSEQYQREALSAVLMGTDTTLFTAEDQEKLTDLREAFLTAKEAYENGDELAGLEMEAARENAEALATAAYESSEQYQKLQDTQMDQITAIRDNTAGLAAATNAYLLNQELSKGEAATPDYVSPLEKIANFIDWNALYYNVVGGSSGFAYGSFGHAYGLDRVPYDEYPALLHEGERVLTASEAREQDAAHGGAVYQISVTGNNFVGTGEEMADQLAEVIARKLEAAAAVAVPR